MKFFNGDIILSGPDSNEYIEKAKRYLKRHGCNQDLVKMTRSKGSITVYARKVVEINE